MGIHVKDLVINSGFLPQEAVCKRAQFERTLNGQICDAEIQAEEPRYNLGIIGT